MRGNAGRFTRGSAINPLRQGKVYLFVCVMSHMTAEFSARVATSARTGSGSSAAPARCYRVQATVVLHYFLRPLILFTHLDCGLCNVRFAGSGSLLFSDRWATGMIATGALVGSVIHAALFDVAEEERVVRLRRCWERLSD